MQERSWTLRWRNPAFCKPLLYGALKHAPGSVSGGRPLQFNLAWLERWAGNFDAAARLADEAFRLMDHKTDPEGWSELLVIKSVCVYSLGEISLADEILGESLEILGPAAHGRAGIEPLTVLANMCAYYHDYEKARSKLDEAMAIADKLGLIFERAHILQTLSRTELRCGSVDAAMTAARSCLEDALRHRNAVNLPYAYEVLGAALVETGDLKQARDSAKKGLEAAQFSQDQRVACHLHYVLGNSLYEEKRYDEARAELEHGLLNATAADYHHWTRNFYDKLSQTHEALEEHRSALMYLKAYVKLQKKMFTEESERQSNDFRNRLEFRLARSKAAHKRQMRTKTERLNRDLSEANRALRDLNAQIEHNALHDALTGVGNRRMMARFFETARTDLQPGTEVAAVLIDLDRFKSVNDHLGHAAGDHVIQTVANRLSVLLQDDEMLIRMGGDEFLVLSIRRTCRETLAALAERAIRDINQPMSVLDGQARSIGASIGAAVRPAGPGLEIELLRAADEAMYEAKQTGRNRSSLDTSPDGSQARDVS